MTNKANFSMISLGCARTLVDSEKMIDSLQKVGFNLVQEGSGEVVTILNTCSFIQAAIDETEHNIDTLIQDKKSGKLKHLAVVGCYPGRFKPNELEEKYPEVDLWLTTKEEFKLPKKLSELVFQKKYQPTPTQTPYIKLTPSHYAYLKISEGCNNWCSFCTIPKIRGEHKSKSIEDILTEAKLQLSMGAKELVLVAEDTTCWGEDLYGKPSLPLLLKELAKLPVPWIRLMYIYPTRVDQDLITTIKSHDNIINYIDMPIQHVNSDILKGMKRRHDKQHLIDVFNTFKKEIPDIAFRTTFILGFPGETDAHVEEIQNFITEYPFTQLGCFAFSYEKETYSARLPEQVSNTTARKRIDTIMSTQYNLLKTRNEKRIDQKINILYEGHKQARSIAEAPDVDNKIMIQDPPNDIKPGEFYEATISGTSGYDLLATL